MASTFLDRIYELTKTAPVDPFITMFNRNRTHGGVQRYIKDALRDSDMPHDLAWWQKNEMLNLSQKEVSVDSAAQLSVSARVAFELAAADKRLGFRSHEHLKNLAITFGPAVQQQLEIEVGSAPRAKYISTRSIIAEKLTQPLQRWLTRNKEEIVAQAAQYPDTTLFIDRLPENGEDFSYRVYSRQALLQELYKNKLRTTRDIGAPEKASFTKKTKAA